MGLSIGAFLVTGPGEEDRDYHFLNNPDFPGRADIATGWYTAETLAPSVHWSYSGYSEFREWLARQVFPDTAPGMNAIELKNEGLSDYYERAYRMGHPAFYRVIETPGCKLHELINFSDCEGVFGHATCTKILADMESLGEPIATPDWHGTRHLEHFAALKTAIKAVVDAGPLAVLDFA